jgi:ATP-dependent protease ClpP protease subunit
MANRVEIRGVIVPAEYDMDWFRDEIAKGIITPESSVRAQVESLDDSQPVELYINSVGGSVFAGHEMLNVLVDWRERTGQPIRVTVGSMSASAASTIAVMLGPVQAHENTMFMFHSARSCQCGGPAAMGDMAELLDKINRMVTTTLVSRYSVDPDRVAEWFSEGRMGWMDAEEAAAVGLVHEIVPAAGEPIQMTEKDIGAMQERGLAVAALLEADPTQAAEDYAMSILNKIADKLGMSAEEAAEDAIADKIDAMQSAVDDANARAEAAEADVKDKSEAAYDEGKAAGIDAGKVEAKEQIDSLTAQVETLTAERDAAVQAKEDAEKRADALTAGFGASDNDDGAGGDFWDKVEELVSDGVSKEQAMLTVQREHSELYQEMIRNANKQ